MGLKAFFKRAGVVIYKHRADIEFVAGLGLVTTGTVLLIKDSEKISQAIRDHRSRAELLEDIDNENEKEPGAGWVDNNERREYIKKDIKATVKDLGLTVGKDCAFIIGGEVLQGISHVSLNKQVANATLLAANLSAAYANLKNKIIEDQGEEKLNEYLYGPQIKTVVVDENGNVTETTKMVYDENAAAGLPPHCFFFDEGSKLFSKSHGVNRDTVENMGFWLNQRLEKEGFLFENDIRREFKVPIVECGWTSGIMAKNPDGSTNRLSFGLERPDAAARRFLDGDEDVLLIKMNLEDNILPKLHLFKH